MCVAQILANHLGQIDGEEREHYHAHARQNGRQDLARRRERIDRRTDRCHLQTAPPKRAPVGRYAGIDGLLAGKEEYARKIEHKHHYRQIGSEDADNPVGRHISHHDCHCPRPADERNEADVVERVGREIDREQVDEVQIGNRDEQKPDVVPRVGPMPVSDGNPDQIVEDEEDTNAQLKGHVDAVVKKIDIVENLVGHERDERSRENEYDRMQNAKRVFTLGRGELFEVESVHSDDGMIIIK